MTEQPMTGATVQPGERTPLPVDPRYARKREIDRARPASRRFWWAIRKAQKRAHE